MIHYFRDVRRRPNTTKRRSGDRHPANFGALYIYAMSNEAKFAPNGPTQSLSQSYKSIRMTPRPVALFSTTPSSRPLAHRTNQRTSDHNPATATDREPTRHPVG